MITPLWMTEADVPSLQPATGYWQSLLVEDDPDLESRTYSRLFAVRRPWWRGCIDDLLRDIADDKVTGVRLKRLQYRPETLDGFNCNFAPRLTISLPTRSDPLPRALETVTPDTTDLNRETTCPAMT
ncbi:hypothetical protein [Streptomyces sp. NPDC050982]|uniref:DUF3885 domain-containing protein n=1 Tax=Streptomyces sp. NPDC050982 TaxID=3154746 RepID=UPI0033F87583